MLPASKLKQNLDFNKDLGELIDVMKLAATLQFHQFRTAHEPYDEFVRIVEKIVGFIPVKNSENPFLYSQQNAPKIIVLITSDEGFLGELNTLLLNKLTDNLSGHEKVVLLGEQGREYLEDLHIVYDNLPLVTERLESERIEALRDYIYDNYTKGSFSGVRIIYSRFINISFQQIEAEDLLPLSLGLFERPQRKVGEFDFEPDIDTVIDACVKFWLLGKLQRIFWASKLAEFSARIIHLEGSTQELNRLNQGLRVEYFKYLHGLSDKTIREILSSRLKTRR